MPIHDWSRVDVGIFHDFQNVWIGQLRNAMNNGLLPPGFYALTEQHAGKYIADSLSLQKPLPETVNPGISGGVAIAVAPPNVRRQVSLSRSARTLRKTLAIRHVSNHQVIALVEIVSPRNKDRAESVREFLDKIEDVLSHGIHVLLVDLFPPGKHDPNGLHAALWQRMGDEFEGPPSGEPLTFASYCRRQPGASVSGIPHLRTIAA